MSFELQIEPRLDPGPSGEHDAGIEEPCKGFPGGPWDVFIRFRFFF